MLSVQKSTGSAYKTAGTAVLDSPAFLDALGAGFCLHSGGGALLVANTVARELIDLGLSVSAPDGAERCAAVDLSGAPLPAEEHPTAIALRTGEPVRGVVLGVHPGTPRARWVRIDAAVLAPEVTGTAGSVATLMVDVTIETERARESAVAAERAARLMEPVADVICRLDAAGRFVDVTRSSAQVLGYAPEDLFGRSLAGLVHVDGAGELARALTAARSSGRGHVVVRCRRSDGELRWMDVVAGRVQSAGSTTGELHAVLRDVHDQVLAENARRESDRRYRLLADNTGDVVCVHDPHGRFRYASPSALALLGYHPDDLADRPVGHLVHPEDAARVEAVLADLRAAIDDDDRSLTYRLQHRDGGWVWVETTWRPVLDDDGRLIEIHATSRDVSQRVAGDEALAAAEESFRVAFDAAGHPMARLTPDGRLQRVNDALCALIGRTCTELEGRSLRAVTHPDDVDPVAALQERLAVGGNELRRDQRLLRRDGSTVWVDLTLTAVPDAAGAVRHMVAHLVDTTAERVLTEQLRRLDLHDPLTAAGTVDLLRNRLATALADPRTPGVAVMRVDLDGFRRLNDARGHVAADRVLVMTVQRLRSAARDADLVARIGGDDFAVLCVGVDHGYVERLAQRVSRGLSGSVGGVGPVSASIGVATARPGDDVDDVLNRAEAALSVVKRSGGDGWAVD